MEQTTPHPNCSGCGVLRGVGYRHHHNCITQLGGQVAK